MRDLSVYKALLQLPELVITDVKIDGEPIIIFCKKGEELSQKCPKCKRIVNRKTPKYTREVQDLNISGRAVYLHIESHQYLCECGKHFMEQFDLVETGKSYTRRQSKWIIEMSRKQSHKEVGRLVQMNHKTVERICYRSVSIRVVDWTKIRQIGIDEFAFKKDIRTLLQL
jgi:transposase